MGNSGRPQHPMRPEVKRIYLEHDGKITRKELSEIAGVAPTRITEWRKADDWDGDLERQREEQNKRKRGGQPGNTNAVGHGAPPGNTNAEKHGAFSTVSLDRLPEKTRANIEALGANPLDHMHREYLLLLVKEEDLMLRIDALDGAGDGAVYLDTQIHMITPRKPQEGAEDGENGNEQDDSDNNMQTSYKMMFQSSAFNRRAKLEDQLHKVRGRIAKALDSMRVHDLELKRFELEAKKYRLRKQELSGQFNFNPETGEIDDETDEDEE